MTKIIGKLAEVVGQQVIHLYEKLASIIRWRIALFLNRFRDVCWHDAVCWAVYPENHPFSEVFALRRTAGGCEADGDVPYCGKCAVLAGAGEILREGRMVNQCT